MEHVMVAFEITINGERHCGADDITAVTVVADWVQRRQADRVSVHVGRAEGSGALGERPLHWLGAHLGPGDVVTIHIVEAVETRKETPSACSFCGSGVGDIASLVEGRDVAICNLCIATLGAAVKAGGPLPLGASLRDDPEWPCGFCGTPPGDIPGVLVRNGSAICAECLRSCSDIAQSGA
jgi:ClpX C4-type zinc finger